MNANRRDFLTRTGLLAGFASLAPSCLAAETPVAVHASRDEWIALAEKLARPVLTQLAARTLRKNMPVEQLRGAKREAFSHLETFGRLMAGIAPWLEQDRPATCLKLAQDAIDAATDPSWPLRHLPHRRLPLAGAHCLATRTTARPQAGAGALRLERRHPALRRHGRRAGRQSD